MKKFSIGIFGIIGILVLVVFASGCIGSNNNTTSSPSNGASTTYENQYMSFNKSSDWVVNSTDGGLMNGIYDTTDTTPNGNPAILGSIFILNSDNGGVDETLQDAKINDSAVISRETINGVNAYVYTDPVLRSWVVIYPTGNDNGISLVISTNADKSKFDIIKNSVVVKK